MNNITNDIPKYRKKSSASPPTKAKHKHAYEPCLIEHPLDWWNKPHERKRYLPHLTFTSYCPVCGKVGGGDPRRWFVSGKKYDDVGCPYVTVEHTDEAKRELDPATRTLPVFKVDDPFAKFVEINMEETE